MIIALFGTVFVVALLKGFLHARARRISPHREWMIRAFTVGLSIATMRLILFPSLLIIGDPTDGQFVVLWVGSFVAGFALNVLVAEARIRATRRSGAPRAGAVKVA